MLPHLSRRRLLGGAALATTLPALAACSGATGRDPDTVAVWDLFSGADGANMRGMIADVVADGDGLTVDPTTLAWGSPYYTKLAMAASSQSPPDTAIMHVSRMPGFAPGGLLEPWDLTQLADVGPTQQDFTEALWTSCTYEGELFAVPLDTHPFIVFFDPEIAEQANVLEADGTIEIDSPERFAEVGRKLGEVTGSAGIGFGFLLDTAQAWRLFWGLYHQTGGHATIEVGSPAELDIDAAASVIDAIHSWMDGTVMPPDQDYGGALAAFNNGRNGMILSGEWELTGFLDAKGEQNVAAMPMPTMFGTPANYADSHAYVLPAQRDVSEEHRQRIYEFVAAVLALGDQWGTAGHIPAYLPAQDSAMYRELTIQNSYKQAAEVAVFDPPVWFAGGGTDFQNRMSQALIEGFRGHKEPGRAAESLVDVLNDMLASPDPTV